MNGNGLLIKNIMKLINKTTNEEHICTKVEIDGFDYYIGDTVTDIETLHVWHTSSDSEYHPYTQFIGNTFYAVEEFEKGNFKKIIATTNPNIDIPKVIDVVELMIKSHFYKRDGVNFKRSTIGADEWIDGLKTGYNQSQSTHPNSDEDMIGFVEWLTKEESPYAVMYGNQKERFADNNKEYSTKELLDIWKEQNKVIYFQP